MKKYFILAFLFLIPLSQVIAQETEDIFTIYLVRHAEKDLSAGTPTDPPLTACGKERAQNLSAFLQEVSLHAIYSTDYSRTQSTAMPTAIDKKLEIQEYNANDLDAFAKVLIDAKQNVLVVGHSNTTAVLAGFLVGEELESFSESIYNRIYQVTMYKKCGKLQLFHTAFTCPN